MLWVNYKISSTARPKKIVAWLCHLWRHISQGGRRPRGTIAEEKEIFSAINNSLLLISYENIYMWVTLPPHIWWLQRNQDRLIYVIRLEHVLTSIAMHVIWNNTIKNATAVQVLLYALNQDSLKKIRGLYNLQSNHSQPLNSTKKS